MPPTRVRPPLRRLAGDDGFTVVEALVSFVILLIASTAAVTVVVAASVTEDDSNTRVIAANLVQRDLQAARALRFPAYPAAGSPRTETIEGDVYTITRYVTATLADGTVIGACPASPDFTARPYMIVTTKVTWLPATARNEVKAATEIAC